VIAAGATIEVRRSRSISAAPTSGSQRYMQTMRRCARYDARYDACSPVTWNSGTASSVPGCSAGTGGSTPATSSRMRRSSSHDNRAASTLRWVDGTPLARPLEPDVYSIVARSSGSIVAAGIATAPSAPVSSVRCRAPGGNRVARTASMCSSGRGARRSSRSWSANTTRAPL